MKTKFLVPKILLLLVLMSFSFVDLDPGYISAFGYGSMCLSINGYPQKDKYDASQFDFRNGKFYVQTGGRIDIRTILPEGKTYGELYSSFKNSNSEMYKDVVYDKLQVIRIFPSHDVSGIQFQFEPWPSDPNQLVNSDGKTLSFSMNDEVLGWNTSGIKWDDPSTQLANDVGMWLDYAQSGWSLYILETVGWTRACPEKKYYSWQSQEWITPYCSEYAPPHAYCILEVK